MGTNDATSTPGAKTPTRAAIGPITAASEYAGEVAASPMTRASTNPIASLFSCAGVPGASCVATPQSPNAERPASSRATGTRNGEHET